MPTWVIAGHPCGAAEHLPAQRVVVPPVLDEDPLQSLGPVQLVEDDGSCGNNVSLRLAAVSGSVL